MTEHKYLATAMVALGLGLGGCASPADVSDIGTLRTTTAKGGTPFTQALSSEYRRAAVDTADIDTQDAAWLARRGLRAAAGEVVLPVDPETLTAWHWSSLFGDGSGLVEGRAQLLAELDGGARERVPREAAHAQSQYDCWAVTGDDDSDCGIDFRKLVVTLKVVEPPAPGPAKVPPPIEAAPDTKGGYQVFFDWNKFDITEDGARTLRLAADRIRQGHVTRIDVVGHTDSSGRPAYNQQLSEHRAAAVRADLIRYGVSPDDIQTFGVGQSGQIVSTPGKAREPQNRRAEITLQP
ncbi:OmpA family protein [Telmatospirillum sp.]|uniref:OmpA family protein n=1 Tax=Telmatospirillum sp. TaxID=2079197 RepID=UPI00284FF4FA|nr:OmpA family protein [Telmatospirillum sp.]MDR3440531.1 OmpA family protein [Telmatospirillum sp.]